MSAAIKVALSLSGTMQEVNTHYSTRGAGNVSACSRSWTSSTSQQPMGRHVTSSPCGSSRSSSRNQRSTSDPTNERESAEEAHIRREHQRRAQPHYNLRERQHTDDNDNQGCYNNPCPRRLSFDNAYLDGKKRKVDESHTEMKTDDLETELPTTVEMAAQGIEDQVDALLHSMESWHLTDLKAFREKRTGISSQVRDQRQYEMSTESNEIFSPLLKQNIAGSRKKN